MGIKRFVIGAVILVSLIISNQAKASNFVEFKDGDKNCFLGNSITQDGRYHMLLQVYFSTCFPESSFEFYNCCIAVNTITNGQLELGINLAENINTPQIKQTEEVFYLCEKYYKINGRIRNMSFVEYRMLNNYKGPDEIEAKRIFLDKELEKQIGKSWYEWNCKTVSKYLEDLPHREELWGELAEIRKQIYSRNRTVERTYILKRL